MKNEILLGDCLDLMPNIPDASIDMILADLPYQTTACKWDIIIPFDKLWAQYERIIKPNGAIVLTGSQPFTSALVMSNIKMFKYSLVWIKNIPTGFWNAKKMQMKIHEDICVFCKSTPTYNPQMVKRTEEEYRKCLRINNSKSNVGESFGGKEQLLIRKTKEDQWYKYPTTEIKIALEDYRNGRGHPTQKPVALFEYLIKTYTNEGDLVLDNTAGSGTTAIAALSTNRQFIVMEKELKYFEIINKRVAEFKEKQGEKLF
jgi:site-specific DNA-methyltransferase (adenine-specific)